MNKPSSLTSSSPSSLTETSQRPKDSDSQRIKIEVYTDGGYFEKQDLGGWGAVIFKQDQEIERESDWQKKTSSLEMELMAAVSALDCVQNRITFDPNFYCITLYTDSRILIEGLTQKIHLWRQNHWIHKSGNPVKYQALWESLERLTKQFQVTWQWVKAHNGNEGNTIADALARQAMLSRLDHNNMTNQHL